MSYCYLQTPLAHVRMGASHYSGRRVEYDTSPAIRYQIRNIISSVGSDIVPVVLVSAEEVGFAVVPQHTSVYGFRIRRRSSSIKGNSGGCGGSGSGEKVEQWEWGWEC